MTGLDATDIRLRTAVRSAAGAVHCRFRRWVDREDTEMEMWKWLVGHREWVAENLSQPAYICRRLTTVGERWARREKAARSGYRPEDEHFYSRTQILGILPDAVDPEARPPAETYRETGLYTEWQTTLADIRSGLKKIPYGDFRVLRAFGRGDRELDGDVRHSVGVLQQKLGGSRPREDRGDGS